jgi:hypothetical protein
MANPIPIRALLLATCLFAPCAVGAAGQSPRPAVDVGDPAPDFTLPSTTGEKVSLSQFRGKQVVLLEFYGADFAPV